jgi:hypothetical protein
MNDFDTVPQRVRRWVENFRSDIVAGRIDLFDVLEAALEECEDQLLVCPLCATRAVRPQTAGGRHGTCQVCHFRRLAHAHRDALAVIEARRELDAAKQAHKRGRDAAGIRPDGSRRSDEK